MFFPLEEWWENAYISVPAKLTPALLYFILESSLPFSSKKSPELALYIAIDCS